MAGKTEGVGVPHPRAQNEPQHTNTEYLMQIFQYFLCVYARVRAYVCTCVPVCVGVLMLSH